MVATLKLLLVKRGQLSSHSVAGGETLLLLWTMGTVPVIAKDICELAKTAAASCYIINSCSFRCAVDWGDGNPPAIKKLDDFGPCQLANDYPKENAQYRVTAFYCSSPPSTSTVACCDMYTRVIDTSFDPGNFTLLF